MDRWRKARDFLALASLVMVAACGPAAATAPQADQPRVPQARTLVLVNRGEPLTLSVKGIPAVSALGDSAARIFFNAALDYVDARETSHPYLATELPRLDSETWLVMPDGRMETTHYLRPEAVWHNGTPLSAHDFAFAWRVYATRDLGHATLRPISEIEEVSVLDPATMIIRWHRPYPDVDRLLFGLPPLPRHILEEAFGRGDLDALVKHPYWTAQYVGLGPWRLDRWEPGAFIEGTGFEGHVLGRPKIDRIRMVFNADSNAVLASMLAGESHVTLPFTIFPEQAEVLSQQGWGGYVVNNPGGWRRMDVQHRPDFVNPRALQRLQVRKAFAHAIDRPALNDAVYLGKGIITDTPIAPSAPYYADLDRALSHYPYDPRRVEQLMLEAGFTRGADGSYGGADGERFSVEIKANSTEAYVKEMAIIAGGWRQAGFATRETVVPIAQSTDQQVRSSFPAFYIGQGTSDESVFEAYTTRRIGGPQNNWVGNNRGGFSDSTFDRLQQAFASTLDRSERNRLVVEMARIMSDQLAAIPLILPVTTAAIAPGLAGPGGWGSGGSFAWNSYLWEWK